MAYMFPSPSISVIDWHCYLNVDDSLRILIFSVFLTIAVPLFLLYYILHLSTSRQVDHLDGMTPIQSLPEQKTLDSNKPKPKGPVERPLPVIR